MEDKTTCEVCEGAGALLRHVNTGSNSSEHYWETTRCSACEGSGKVTYKTAYEQLKKKHEKLVGVVEQQASTTTDPFTALVLGMHAPLKYKLSEVNQPKR